MRREARFPSLLVVLAFLAALTGCGYKTNPVPPAQVIPRAITDLRVHLDERGATLSWTYPRTSVTGRDLSDIEGFLLFHAEIPMDSYCKSCPVPYQEPIEVGGGGVPAEESRTAVYEMTGLRPGNLYFFKVRSRAGWWNDSPDSNEVSFLWQTPPLAPEGLSATSGDARATLAWNPVNRLSDNSSLGVPVQYQIYRGVDGGRPDKLGAPVSGESFTDSTAENGRTYAYQVQAIAVYPQGAVAGALSGEVSAAPVDSTPPLPPARVEGVRTESGVKIFWEQFEAPDLAGYRVYRRVEGEAKATLAGTVFLPHTLFNDTQAPGITLFYSVSSIDLHVPANESAPSNEVRVEP